MHSHSAKIVTTNPGVIIMRLKLGAAALLLCLAGQTGVVRADSFSDGVDAFQRGDYAAALSKWRPIAETGDTRAQSNIGAMYAQGYGVKIDFTEALKWYKLAAAKGDAASQDNIGTLYVNGQGVPQDFVEAMRWYRLSAAQGNADAQFNIGSMYDRGQGVAVDYVEARKWYLLAANQKNASAQENLGALYGLGRGTPTDFVRAYMWFSLAVQNATDPKAKAVNESNRDRVAGVMTSLQIVEAQQMVQSWKPEK